MGEEAAEKQRHINAALELAGTIRADFFGVAGRAHLLLAELVCEMVADTSPSRHG